MRKISVLWIILAVLAMLAIAGAPAASLALGSGGGVHLACEAGGTGGCAG